MKVLAFAGSNSSKSINHQLVTFVASLINSSEVVKLTDYDIPMYSMDIEENEGIPEDVKNLNLKLETSDKLIISVAEHNGNITAFFKNTIDWLSRHNNGFLKNKKIILLSTSPGKGGAASALKITEKTLPYFGAEIVGRLSVASFYENMKEGIVTNKELAQNLKNIASKFN